MSRWIQLSYVLSGLTPSYGNRRSLELVYEKSIENGDSCNTRLMTMPNHLGTHIDAPLHFNKSGKSVTDFPVNFWIIKRSHLIDVEASNKGFYIDTQCIGWESVPKDVELIFLKTGFCSKRGESSYIHEGPVFSPELADKMRNEFPSIRIFGIDAISISSLKNREIGRKAHAAFLSHEKPILLLEDVNLLEVNSSTKFNKIVISPLMMLNSDGAPCTVFAEVE